jgi:nucleoside-diphosphate-sugar epimerase
MRIVITGGAGFIGCNLAEACIRAGHRVTIFDNLSRRGSQANLDWLRASFGDGFRFVAGDIRDYPAILAAAAGQEAIYHLAAQTAVTTSVTDPRPDFEINALGTFNVLEAARNAGHDPVFIYSSTNKVYGGMEDAPATELPTRYVLEAYPNGVSEERPLDFHSPYGCCYSADTDVLTRLGWRKFPELSDADEVLTYNMERKVAEYQKPIEHFAYHYTGKMYVQVNRRLRACVTPNHKMLVAWKRTREGLVDPRLIEAQSIAGKPMAYLLAADVADGEERSHFVLPGVIGEKHKHDFSPRAIPMDDWLRFLGWYLSEGHCYANANTGNATVSLTTYYRTEEAVEVMRAVGLSPVVDQHHVTATSRQFYTYLSQLGKSHDKYIPTEFRQLARPHLEVLLKALLDGDGGKTSKNSWRYTTVSKRLADDVQEVAIRCGKASSVTRDRQGFYRVYLGDARTAHCNLDENRSTWVDYDAPVYCVEVPNSVVLVRQSGHAYFAGNSKGSADQYVRDYARIYGLRSVVFRQSCIQGQRQMGVEDQGWVAWFVIATIMGKPITIYGNGKQVRDLLHVDDLVRAFQMATEQIDVTRGQVYNLGGGPANTLSIWAEFGPLLKELTGREVVPAAWRDWRPGDQPVFVADVSKAWREFGWAPQVSVRDGIARLVEWVKANRELFA